MPAQDSRPLVDGRVALQSGSATSEIPIRVPGFRGLEPVLSLRYGSGLREGWAGVGWTLAGFSYIDRVGPERGLATGTTADLFLLDGQPLVPCNLRGSTHCTRDDGYARIRQSGNEWLVMDQLGRRRVYGPILSQGGTPYRWALTSFSDLLGNTVSYTYQCSAAGCTPDTITYNGAQVRFYSDARAVADVLTSPNGLGSVNTESLLRVIEVKVGGEVASAMRLDYTRSPVTNRFVLREVRHYGRSAVTSTGSIGWQVSGTELPRYTFQWSTDQDSASTLLAVPGKVEMSTFSNAPADVVTGDFDGDGRTDLIYFHNPRASSTPAEGSLNGRAPRALLKRGPVELLAGQSGVSAVKDLSSLFGADTATTTALAGEFTGDDGATDLLLWRTPTTTTPILASAPGLGTGISSTTLPSSALRGGVGSACNDMLYGVRLLRDVTPATHQLLTADFDGDGLTDLLSLASDGCATLHFRAGGSFVRQDNLGLSARSYAVGDFNGDGVPDLIADSDVFLGQRSQPRQLVFHKTSLQTLYPQALLHKKQPILGDFNGDGRTDIFFRPLDGQSDTTAVQLLARSAVFAAGGMGFDVTLLGTNPFGLSTRQVRAMAATAAQGYLVLPGDHDGDGATDLLFALYDDESGARSTEPFLVLVQGSGRGLQGSSRTLGTPAAVAAYFPYGYAHVRKFWRSQLAVGDYDGDGLQDVLLPVHPSAPATQTPAPSPTWAGLAPRRLRRDLLTRWSNGLGGATSVEYAPSAELTSVDPQWYGYVQPPPPGFSFPAVKAMSHLGASGQLLGKTSYAYQTPRWSYSERRPLGFRQVVETETDAAPLHGGRVGPGGIPDPLQAVLRTTELGWQEGCAESIESVKLEAVRSNGARVLLHHEERLLDALAYDTALSRYSGPWPATQLAFTPDRVTGGGLLGWCRPRSRWTTVCAESGTPGCLGTHEVYTYDDTFLGRVRRVDEYGAMPRSPGQPLPTGAQPLRSRVTDHFYVNSSFRLQVLESRRATVAADTTLEETRFCYDGLCDAIGSGVGLLTHVKEWVDTADAWWARSYLYRTTQYGYDAVGNRVRTTAPDGIVSTTDYDALFRVFPIRSCAATNVYGNLFCSSSTWDYVLGLQTSATDVSGLTVSRTHDGFGRLVSETHPDGSSTRFSYQSPATGGSVATMQRLSPGGRLIAWNEEKLDELGRSVRSRRYNGDVQGQPRYSDVLRSYIGRTPLAGAVSRPYDAAVESPVYETRFYDALGALRVAVAGDSATITQRYTVDSYGVADTRGVIEPRSCVERTDELGRTSLRCQDRLGYDAFSRDAAGALTRFENDALGRPTRVVDPLGAQTVSTYNTLGWKVVSSAPDRGLSVFGYDLMGRMERRQDARGLWTDYHYDPLGRLVETYGSGGTSVFREYDSAPGAGRGRLARVEYPHGAESYAYDTLGRLIREERCLERAWWARMYPLECHAMEFLHDEASRLATVVYPDGEEVSYAYDAAGRLTAVTNGDGRRYVDQMTYDARDRLIFERVNDGRATHSFAYAAARGSLLSAQVVAGGGGTAFQAGYTYQANGQLASVAYTLPGSGVLNGSLRYAYDSVDRLTSVTGSQNETFTYDGAGRLLSKTGVGAYTYGAQGRPHAVTRAGTQVYQYDAAGNLTSDGTRTFTHDDQGRLTAVTDAFGRSSLFLYGQDDERIGRRDTAGNARYYLGRFLEMDTSGSLIRHIYAGPRLVASRVGPNTHYYHQDRLGSIRVVTDAQGAIVRQCDYLPFGDTASCTGLQGPVGYFDFQGHRRDDTRLLYMNARYYDSTLGRFISADPLVPEPRNPQSWDRYAFAFNDPVNNTDPTGHTPESPGDEWWKLRYPGITVLPEVVVTANRPDGMTQWLAWREYERWLEHRRRGAEEKRQAERRFMDRELMDALAQHAWDNVPFKNSTGWCSEYVSKCLFSFGYKDQYGGRVASPLARDAYNNMLARFGFKETISTSKDWSLLAELPQGAVVVYQPVSPKRAGHVEIIVQRDSLLYGVSDFPWPIHADSREKRPVLYKSFSVYVPTWWPE
jgi:RHS repeat-associated protein